MKNIESEEFLTLIWPQTLLRDETLELRAINRQSRVVRRRFATSILEFLKVARAFGPGWDIYFGVCTRYGQGGTKEQCYRVNCVWVDYDNTLKLPDFKKIQPDIVVNSGTGFHTYWLLETPILVKNGRWIEIEAINRGLIRNFTHGYVALDDSKKSGPDRMTIDITRILRVPRFYNYKYDPAKKVVANAVQTL